MIIRILALMLIAKGAVAADQWQQTGANTSSLRAGGALLVSSDALALQQGKSALITYWQVHKGIDISDVYRCIDVIDENFDTVGAQSCKKVLAAEGRRPF